MDRELDVSYQRRRIGRRFALAAHGARFGLENRPEGGAEFRIQF